MTMKCIKIEQQLYKGNIYKNIHIWYEYNFRKYLETFVIWMGWIEIYI